jgi:hypothetical protein
MEIFVYLGKLIRKSLHTFSTNGLFLIQDWPSPGIWRVPCRERRLSAPCLPSKPSALGYCYSSEQEEQSLLTRGPTQLAEVTSHLHAFQTPNLISGHLSASVCQRPPSLGYVELAEVGPSSCSHIQAMWPLPV